MGLNLSGHVYACDASLLAPAFHLADGAFLVPPYSDPSFPDRLLELCLEHGIRLVVPTIDPELLPLAARRQDFLSRGITVAVSSPEVITIGCDKRATHGWLRAHRLPTVRQWTTSEHHLDAINYPAIAKPRYGSASQGVRYATQPSDINQLWSPGMDEYVIEEIATGAEFTIDFFCDQHGTIQCAVPRRRIAVRGGEVSKALTVRHPALSELMASIGAALPPGAVGALNLQCFLDQETGALNVIELNPRFGGGFPLSYEAGADFPTWLIQLALDMPVDASNEWRAGLLMLRFDDELFLEATDEEVRRYTF